MGILTKIRKIRMDKGYSQEYMALKLGINQSSYCKMENNQRKIKMDRIEEIARLLNTDITRLIDAKQN